MGTLVRSYAHSLRPLGGGACVAVALGPWHTGAWRRGVMQSSRPHGDVLGAAHRLATHQYRISPCESHFIMAGRGDVGVLRLVRRLCA